jgi:DNA (cytosine-5)-methyltransferase 1
LAFSEIEKFPRSVLAHHYPGVPCHGDFTLLRDQEWIVDADVLVGGTPCQAFSVAGKRASLSDDRGNLTLEFVRLADAIDRFRRVARKEPAVIVWENVPGVLSVADNAFGCFLAALVGEDTPLVPTRGKWTNAGMVVGPERAAAWRILDAQYFGVAQRRRRLFVVASARNAFDPAEVLFESDGVRRDTPPSRAAGEAIAGGAGEGASSDGEQPYSVANCLTARTHKGINSTLDEGQTPIVQRPVLTFRWQNDDAGMIEDPVAASLKAKGTTTDERSVGAYVAQAYDLRGREGGAQLEGPHDTANIRAASGGSSRSYVAAAAVRRLTPRECERLQGFPDDYTLLGDATPDGPRYKALGNSMAVPVMRWIGRRIANAFA